jgi:hypothetical protein
MRRARTGETRTVRCRTSLVRLAAIACAMTIVACGSASQPRTTAGSGHAAPGIKFADCMRAHGVPNFPDPGAGGGIEIPSGSGLNPFSPSFKAGQAACAKLMPGGPPSTRHPSAAQINQMRQISVCMRAHGVSGFPDPTLTPPASAAGYGLLENRGGVVLAIPDTINTEAPVFKQAGAACGFPTP